MKNKLNIHNNTFLDKQTRISGISLKEEGESVILSALIERGKSKGMEIYFRVPVEYKNYINTDGSSFLAALLLPAMKNGERLKIDGTVSQKLISNVSAIKELLFSWDQGFQNTEVTSQEVKSDDNTKADRVACFFSGGVDSFYTFLKNKHENHEKITHFIFVHGFDVDLNNKRLFEETLCNIKNIAENEGVEVIVIETNLRDIVDPMLEWGFSFGGALASIGLLLRNGFKKIYIPSSNSYDELFPWGSHPDLDHLWSTEGLTFIHDGSEADRLEKIQKYIAKSDLALQYLRVCYRNERGEYNCSRCEKCFRTMVELRVAGVLDKCQTFKPFDMGAFKKIDARGHIPQMYFQKSLSALKKNNSDKELRDALEYVLSNKEHSSYKTKIRDFVNEFDGKHLNHFIYKLISRNKLPL